MRGVQLGRVLPVPTLPKRRAVEGYKAGQRLRRQNQEHVKVDCKEV